MGKILGYEFQSRKMPGPACHQIKDSHSIKVLPSQSATAAKYLGVSISDDLSWGTHVNNISKKANQTLGFLKRNIKVHKQDLKSTAYKTLVRP